MSASSPQSPGELLSSLLDERGWNQTDLAMVTGFSRQTIHQLIHGKSGITPETSLALGAAFGNDPIAWLRMDSERRLQESEVKTDDVARRSAVLDFAPVREMQNRGWIEAAQDFEHLESELRSFFAVSDLQEVGKVQAAFRMNGQGGSNERAVRAWYRRAQQLAEILPAAKFRPEQFPKLLKELRLVAAFAKEAHRVPSILAKYGIRFVVVEHLKGTKLDGAAFWLDDRSPVVAMSIRFDRVDAFWFTLLHELKHIEHGDGQSIDEDLSAKRAGQMDENDPEERANRGAAACLIEPRELDSFVNRVSPLYSTDRVVQFAQRIKIHPGIVVGQLQHRGELGFEALRKLLVKVRSVAIETALTDGWGKTAPVLSRGR